MPRPVLVVRVGAREWTRLEAPAFGARAWLLGVVAVQLTLESEPHAQVRAHVTGGGAARTTPLAAADVVHVTLALPGSALPEAPALPPAMGEPALTLFLDGALVDAAPIARALSARGFGHVFCRWLRAGGCEPGFDLTNVESLPPGRKFERRLVRPLALGQTVSYRWVASTGR